MLYVDCLLVFRIIGIERGFLVIRVLKNKCGILCKIGMLKSSESINGRVV